MPTINIAFTAPINPSGTTPAISLQQVWAGLLRKIRHPEECVPVIVGAEVLEEKNEGDLPVVVREVTFKQGFREGGDKVTEVCKCYEPTMVDFHQPDGSVISNVVSLDADDALLMTFSFSWRHPDATTSDVEELRKKHQAGARIAVETTIRAIREMVKDGRIE